MIHGNFHCFDMAIWKNSNDLYPLVYHQPGIDGYHDLGIFQLLGYPLFIAGKIHYFYGNFQ